MAKASTAATQGFSIPVPLTSSGRRSGPATPAMRTVSPFTSRSSTPITSQLTENGANSYLGATLGTYDLGSGFGLRGGLEFKPVLSALYTQVGADLLYSTGESTVFYVGAGGGYSTAAGTDALYVAGTAGLDLDAASFISFFAEAQPRYNLTTEAGQLFVRAGLNLHFGDE